jgi:hypothetical protein
VRRRGVPQCQQGLPQAVHRFAYQAARVWRVLRFLRTGRAADHRRSHHIQSRMGGCHRSRHVEKERRLSVPEDRRAEYHGRHLGRGVGFRSRRGSISGALRRGADHRRPHQPRDYMQLGLLQPPSGGRYGRRRPQENTDPGLCRDHFPNVRPGENKIIETVASKATEYFAYVQLRQGRPGCGEPALHRRAEQGNSDGSGALRGYLPEAGGGACAAVVRRS